MDMDVVTRDNAYLYREELDEMYRLRHRYFVDQKRWLDLRKVDGRERDQFDNEDATYLLLFDEGTVVGTHRLLPTTEPHLFTEVFSELCSVRGIQRRHDIYEAGRTCLDEELLDRGTLRRLRRLIMVGLFEFCTRAGLSQFVTLCPISVVHQYVKIGLAVRPLGIPKEIDGVVCVAASFPTFERDLEMVRAALKVSGNIVRYIGPQSPLEQCSYPAVPSFNAPLMAAGIQ